MAALTADRDTPCSYSERTKRLAVKAATKIYAGALVAIDATGYALPAADAAGHVVQGRCTVGADNTGGANGAKYVEVDVGVFSYNVSAALLASGWASTGVSVEVQDDNTVALPGDAGTVNNIAAGKLEYIDAEGLFWFKVGI